MYIYSVKSMTSCACLSRNMAGRLSVRADRENTPLQPPQWRPQVLRWISAAALHIVLSFVDLRRDLRCCGTAGRTFTVTDIVTGVVAAPRRSPEAAGKPRKL